MTFLVIKCRDNCSLDVKVNERKNYFQHKNAIKDKNVQNYEKGQFFMENKCRDNCSLDENVNKRKNSLELMQRYVMRSFCISFN